MAKKKSQIRKDTPRFIEFDEEKMVFFTQFF